MIFLINFYKKNETILYLCIIYKQKIKIKTVD